MFELTAIFLVCCFVFAFPQIVSSLAKLMGDPPTQSDREQMAGKGEL
jgi:hypothetical protein